MIDLVFPQRFADKHDRFSSWFENGTHLLLGGQREFSSRRMGGKTWARSRRLFAP